MEGMAYLCSDQQRIEELKLSLFCTSLDLESVQLAAQEEKRRADETIKQLLQLLKAVFQERDAAKHQLQMLLNKFMELTHVAPNLPTECPITIPSNGHSTITESDSLSDAYNHSSHVSSPVDSLVEVVTSPDSSNMMDMAISSNMAAPSHPILQESKEFSSYAISSGNIQLIPASAIIDRYAMKKPLPEQGNLLQTVVEAGPLLQTLLVAGPLPQWQNPPPPQSLHIPPAFVNEHVNSSMFIQKQAVSQSSSRTSNDATLACSTSILKSPASSYCVGDCFPNIPNQMGKRRKFQC